MMDQQGSAMEGGSYTCGAVRYRLKGQPLFVHCCHCTWCQRETGSAFAVNAFIEASQVELLNASTKQPWVVLPDGVPAVAEFYRPADYWPVESTARFKAARAAAG